MVKIGCTFVLLEKMDIVAQVKVVEFFVGSLSSDPCDTFNRDLIPV